MSLLNLHMILTLALTLIKGNRIASQDEEAAHNPAQHGRRTCHGGGSTVCGKQSSGRAVCYDPRDRKAGERALWLFCVRSFFVLLIRRIAPYFLCPFLFWPVAYRPLPIGWLQDHERARLGSLALDLKIVDQWSLHMIGWAGTSAMILISDGVC